MRKLLFLSVIVIIVFVLISCSGTVLNGRYVEIWDFNEEGDAVSVYEFSRKGDLIQTLNIDPYEALDFKGVEDTILGKYELKDNLLKIILNEGSYEMPVLENTKEYMIVGIPQADGSVWERKYIKE